LPVAKGYSFNFFLFGIPTLSDAAHADRSTVAVTILSAYEVADSDCGFSCQLQRAILLTFYFYFSTLSDAAHADRSTVAVTIMSAYEVTDSGCGFSCQLQRVIL